MKHFILTICIITSLSLSYGSFALDDQSQCSKFNSVVLQLVLAQDGMQAPLNLEQLQNILGKGNVVSTSIITTYTWNYGQKRSLVVQTNNSNISSRFLTGNDDGSPTSRKMEQIYEKLKSATSIWIIKDIQQQLGPGYVTSSNKSQNYNWSCGIGFLESTVDHNNNISAAKISYKTSQNSDIIEAQVGFSHPEWNVKIDSIAYSYRAWQRLYSSS